MLLLMLQDDVKYAVSSLRYKLGGFKAMSQFHLMDLSESVNLGGMHIATHSMHVGMACAPPCVQHTLEKVRTRSVK